MSLTDYYETDSKIVKVPYELKWLYKGIVQFICLDGNAFVKIGQGSMETLLGPIARAFNITLNRDNVHDLILKEAKKYRKMLSDKLKDCVLVPIKFDFCTNHRKSFLGVTTQLNDKGKIKVYTLGCIEIFERHTGENIKSFIIDLLKTFDLNLDNILASATDNGSNVVKGSAELNNEQIDTFINSILEKMKASEVEQCNENEQNDGDFGESEYMDILNKLKDFLGIIGKYLQNNKRE